MKLLIDNLDGLGALDYSAAVDRAAAVKRGGLRIERKLNAPSILSVMLCLEGSGLGAPVRRGRVTVSSDAGAVLFTGYLATEPLGEYAGVASEGAVYRLSVSAVSDEWLLDKQSAGSSIGPALGDPGGSILKTLSVRLDPSRLVTSGITDGRLVGVFEPQAGALWSEHAGAVADSTYSAYRVLSGALSLVAAGSVQHAQNDGDGTLKLSGLSSGAVRELANDITLSGEMAASTYWTELFAGDGTTTDFLLTGEPSAPSAGKKTLLYELFSSSAINGQVWAVIDPGSHLSLSSKGLTLAGGNGLDGQTLLTAYDAIELGGTIVVELSDVVLGAGSAGVVAGLYNGITMQVNCFAGFTIRQAGGQTVLAPIVNGIEVSTGAGTAFTLLDGHRYTLRIRLHCAEMERIKQTYYAYVGGAVKQFGGGLQDASVALVFEIRDQASSSNTPVTVLFDASVLLAPARASFVAINSVQLFGSIGSVRVHRTGSAAVRSTAAQTGVVRTRLVGLASEGVDCAVHSSVTGRVTFFTGRIPVAGEIVTVTYRGQRRAVARLADGTSLAAEAAGGGVGTARWVGHMGHPVARSPEDCERAAEAMLGFATDRGAALAGSYDLVNPGSLSNPGALGSDIWPGDVLALTANGSSVSVLIRRVAVEEHGASPEALLYRIAFANDWAEGIGLHVSEAIAKDALLPELALTVPLGDSGGTVPPHVLANLQQITVTESTGTGAAAALTVDAGMDAPAGGGFEVRRRDGAFGTGYAGSGDLVLRSPVRGFSIPRGAVEEVFFVRMYDASAVPLYSRESSAIATHLPLG